MRVGVIGKTGSGKTTISALVAIVGAGRGGRVVAVDTDVNPNLALSLGLDRATIDRVPVVPRALARGRGGGAVTTAQLLGNYGVPTPSGVTLLHALRIGPEPAGWGCPAHASARSLLGSALEEVDMAVVDMEAGLEHLERPAGTLAHADALLVVVEPSRKSTFIAGRMIARARALGIDNVAVVGNKALPAGGDDDAFLAGATRDCGAAMAGVVPFSPDIVASDRAGEGLALPAGPVRSAVEAIVDALDSPGSRLSDTVG